jgi:putative transposase
MHHFMISRGDSQQLLGLIKRSWLESGGVYGYRKIHDDLRGVGGAVAVTG